MFGPLVPNISYLKDLDYQTSTELELLAPSEAAGLLLEMDELNRDYESRERYHLLNPEIDQRPHTAELAEFSRNLIKRIQRHQVKRIVGPLMAKNRIRLNETLEKSLALVAKIISFYQGTPIDLKLHEDSFFTARLKFTLKWALVGMTANTPIFETSAEILPLGPQILARLSKRIAPNLTLLLEATSQPPSFSQCISIFYTAHI